MKKAVKITDVEVVGPRTTVGVRLRVQGRSVYGRGYSKCCADDVFSEEVGLGIALGRAIADAGEQIAHSASLKVVTWDELLRVRHLAVEQPEIMALATP